MQPANASTVQFRFAANAPFPSSFGDAQMVADPFAANPSSFGSGFMTPPSGTLSTPTYESVSSPLRKPQDPVASAFIGITDLVTKTLITHPCMVLRRQCQVHQFAKSLHLTPLTLIPVVCKIVSSEGFLTLWKGAVGSGVLWCLSTAGEILIADIFGLPRNYVKHGSVEKFCRHLILKASTAIAMTPFIVSAFIETVRSESGLGDEFRVMDVVTNGINRLRFDFIGPKDNSKRFSLLYLSIPTAFLFTSHYMITISFYDWIHAWTSRYVSRKPSHEKTVFDQYYPQIFATLTSQMFADLALYPFETVIHRLYIQGTRTLIDNLDSGVTAISITAKYVGLYDCFRSIIHRESFWSLFAGVGALGLQYVLHLCLLRFVRTLFEYGNRAINVQQQAAPALSSTSTHRMTTPLPFAPTDTVTESSESVADDITINSATRFSPYPAFGQTISAFGRTSPPLLTSTPNIFADRPSMRYPGKSNNY